LLLKTVAWVSTARRDLKSLPTTVVNEIGHQLFRVQCGLEPPDWKPLPIVGPGAREIRVRQKAGTFRVIYASHLPGKIHVLHCFQKKTRKTAASDIGLARARLRAIRSETPHEV